MMNPALNESIVGKVGAVAGGRGELAELNRRKHQDPQVLELQAQVAEKKRREQAEWLRDREETLAHLQQYQMAGAQGDDDAQSGLNNLIRGEESKLERARWELEANGGAENAPPANGVGAPAQPAMNPVTAANMAQRERQKQVFSDNKVKFATQAPSGALGGESERDRRLRERRGQRAPKKVIISSSAAVRRQPARERPPPQPQHQPEHEQQHHHQQHQQQQQQQQQRQHAVPRAFR